MRHHDVRAEQNEHARDGDVHQRPGNRDEKFLAGFFRDALELRDAADRQERDVRRRDAEGACREDVPELVQQHTEEQQQHKRHAVPGARQSTRRVVGNEDPGEKNHEGEVDADNRARDATDIQ